MKDILLKDFTPESELVLPETQKDTPLFPVIDAHTHWGRLLLGDDYPAAYKTSDIVEMLKARGLIGIVNADGAWGDELDKMLSKTDESNGFITTFASVDVTRMYEKDFEKYAYNTIKRAADLGIKGLKFWKVIGLVYKDQDGNYIRPDDERLKCIWQTAAELSLPVLFHIADPTAFFKPIDEYNERYEELGAHPDWAFNAPDLYSFNELMQMQYNMIKANPKTNFICAHVAGYSENLSAVGSWLKQLPNMFIDIAERISELGRQPYTSKKFFTEHADKILFGTDMTPLDFVGRYEIYYRFLETFDEYFRYDITPNGKQGRWRIYGVGLSPEVLEKIYHKNAKRLLNI